MNRVLCFIFLLHYYSTSTFAQSQPAWVAKKSFDQNVFIENNGQFDTRHTEGNAVLFSARLKGMTVYFTSKGLTYRCDEAYLPRHSEDALDELNKEGKEEEENGQLENEELLRKIKRKHHYLGMNWEGASSATTIVGEEMQTNYYTYLPLPGQASIKAKCYKKITYKNLYPNIDAEYVIPEKGGLKYNLIVHPGGDLSQVKIKYQRAKKIVLDEKGNVVISSSFGLDYMEHTPVSYYEDGEAVSAMYELNKNIISFKLPRVSENSARTLIVDPWVSPVKWTNGYTKGMMKGFDSAGNPTYYFQDVANSAYDVDFDYKGNVWVYGGGDPLGLSKYNSSGTLLWTLEESYPMGPTTWKGFDDAYLIVGDFVVNKSSGTAYVCEGFNGDLNDGPKVQKIDANGNCLAISTRIPWTAGGCLEFSRIRLTCDGLLYITGGGIVASLQLLALDTMMQSQAFMPFPSGIHITSDVQGNHDVCLAALDPTTKFIYMCFNRPAAGAANQLNDNELHKIALPSTLPMPASIPDTWLNPGPIHTFRELTTLLYADIGFSPPDTRLNMFNGMVCGNCFLYTYDGKVLKKFDKATGTLVSKVTTGGKMFLTGGLDLDKNENVYASVGNAVEVYDPNNFKLIKKYSLPDSTCYDLKINAQTNKLYACGKGQVCEIDITPPLTFITTSKPAACICNGQATVYAPYCNPSGYKWMPGGAVTDTIKNLCPGNYTVTFSLPPQLGVCGILSQHDTSIVVKVGGSIGGTQITASAASNNLKCFGDKNGTASVTAGGGVAPLTYQWSNGGTAASVSGLGAGTYTVVVKDNSGGNGCNDTLQVTLTQPPILKLLASSSPATCNKKCNGQANIIPMGGTTPYNYSWSNSATIASLNNLCAGSYTITLSDLNGCTHDTTLVIAEPTAFSSVDNASPATCGKSDGSASVVMNGGTGPYSYSWNTGAVTSSLSNIPKGTYTLIVTDAKGCKDTVPVIVQGNSGFTVKSTSASILCFGGKTGTASVSTTGGTAPFTYSWNNGQTTAAINGVGAGTYTCVVNDNSGTCADTVKIILTEPVKLTLQATSSDAICFSACNGTASITGGGGTMPYSYSWNTGAMTATVNTFCVGSYTMTITDQNGCTHDTTLAINEPAPISFTQGTTPTTCNKANGTATTSATGGTAPYSYLWNTGVTASNLSGVNSGTYSLTLTDAKGCTNSVQVLVPTIAPFSLNSADAAVPCHGDKNGVLSATASGTSTPFTYSWNTGATSSSINNLGAGYYTLTVTDVDGCTSVVLDTVKEPTPVLLSSVTKAICTGSAATLNSNTTGGTGPYTYLWNTGNATSTLNDSPTSTTIYTVVTTDANGCTTSQTDTIKVNPVPQAVFTGPNVCTGLPTNFTDASFVSSGAITSWYWDFGDSKNSTTQNPGHTYTTAGTYTVALTVSNGPCQTTMTKSIIVYPTPHADFSANPQPASVMDPTITFTDLSLGGIKGKWYFGDFTDTLYNPGINPVHKYPNDNKAGGESFTIKLSIINQFGCPDSILKTIHIDPQWAFYVPNAFSPNGDPLNEGFFGTGFGIVEKEMWIFDRWGLQIFHSTDLNGVWDGKVQGGQSNELVQQDVYVWVIQIKEIFGNKHRYLGHVTVVR